jgi:uncharacterized protein
MTHHFDGYNYVIRLEKGELLIESLKRLAGELELKSVWLSGLGGALWAELGFYHLDTKQYSWQRFDRMTEITSLQGNLAWQDDKPIWHIHATLSDDTFHAFGGHVKELAVSGTCELLLHALQGEALARRQDPEIGLSLLEL